MPLTMVVTRDVEPLRRGALVMVWRDGTAAGPLRIRTLGTPPKKIVDADVVLLVKRESGIMARSIAFAFFENP